MLRKLDGSNIQKDPGYTIQENSTNDVSLAQVLKSIADDKSLSVFLLIANVRSNGEIILKKLGLTRRQYYSKISAMMKAGLIKRVNGRYYLTPFGKVVYCCTMISKNALDEYYNLKAVEVTTEAHELSNEEIDKLMDVLIKNQQVKKFLTTNC
jgi:NurA-like 5'-3' nuclease